METTLYSVKDVKRFRGHPEKQGARILARIAVNRKPFEFSVILAVVKALKFHFRGKANAEKCARAWSQILVRCGALSRKRIAKPA